MNPKDYDFSKAINAQLTIKLNDNSFTKHILYNEPIVHGKLVDIIDLRPHHEDDVILILYSAESVSRVYVADINSVKIEQRLEEATLEQSVFISSQHGLRTYSRPTTLLYLEEADILKKMKPNCVYNITYIIRRDYEL